MANPLIYFCYGMPKAGSTLAFNLTRVVLEDAGVPQEPLEAPEAIATGAFNSVEIIRPDELAALTDAADLLDRTPIAIKTHSGLWGCVERALTSGWTKGQALCRDPRDIAIAMMDAGAVGAPWGRRNGTPITTPMEALPAVKAHVEKFTLWASHANIMPLSYDLVRYDTETAADMIARQLDLTIDAERCARAGLNMPRADIGDTDGRWRTIMSKTDISAYEDEFGAFITAHDLGTGHKATGGLFTRVKDRLTKGRG